VIDESVQTQLDALRREVDELKGVCRIFADALPQIQIALRASDDAVRAAVSELKDAVRRLGNDGEEWKKP
jgi:hypothetical protein